MTGSTGNRATKVLLWEMDLDKVDRVYARRAYRVLRIAMYAPQSSPYAETGMYQGCYGMERDEAKQFIYAFISTIAWKMYIGSK